MIYLFESNLLNKPVNLALMCIYGIGKIKANYFCKHCGFSFNLKVHDLTEIQKKNLTLLILDSSFIFDNELKRVLIKSKNRLIKIKSYRGLRKLQGLPVRGQRTHTNAKTAKKQKL
mgnify:CR=1 FL=1|jgi:small subunit ribosomal protein S13